MFNRLGRGFSLGGESQSKGSAPTDGAEDAEQESEGNVSLYSLDSLQSLMSQQRIDTSEEPKPITRGSMLWTVLRTNVQKSARNKLEEQLREDPTDLKGAMSLAKLVYKEAMSSSRAASAIDLLRYAALLAEYAYKHASTRSQAMQSIYADIHFAAYQACGIYGDPFNIRAAVRGFEKSLLATDIEMLRRYALALQLSGQPERALSVVETIMRDFPRDRNKPMTQMFAASLLKAKKDFERSGQLLFSVMHAGAPAPFTRTDLLFLLARNFEDWAATERQGGSQHRQAIDGYRMVHKHLRDTNGTQIRRFSEWFASADTWRAVGDKCSIAHLNHLATDLYGQSLAKDPNGFRRPALWFIFAKSCWRCGRMADASLALKQALLLSPDNPQLRRTEQQWERRTSAFAEQSEGTLETILADPPGSANQEDAVVAKLQAYARGRTERSAYLARKADVDARRRDEQQARAAAALAACITRTMYVGNLVTTVVEQKQKKDRTTGAAGGRRGSPNRRGRSRSRSRSPTRGTQGRRRSSSGGVGLMSTMITRPSQAVVVVQQTASVVRAWGVNRNTSRSLKPATFSWQQHYVNPERTANTVRGGAIAVADTQLQTAFPSCEDFTSSEIVLKLIQSLQVDNDSADSIALKWSVTQGNSFECGANALQDIGYLMSIRMSTPAMAGTDSPLSMTSTSVADLTIQLCVHHGAATEVVGEFSVEQLPQLQAAALEEVATERQAQRDHTASAHPSPNGSTSKSGNMSAQEDKEEEEEVYDSVDPGHPAWYLYQRRPLEFVRRLYMSLLWLQALDKGPTLSATVNSLHGLIQRSPLRAEYIAVALLPPTFQRVFLTISVVRNDCMEVSARWASGRFISSKRVSLAQARSSPQYSLKKAILSALSRVQLHKAATREQFKLMLVDAEGLEVRSNASIASQTSLFMKSSGASRTATATSHPLQLYEGPNIFCEQQACVTQLHLQASHALAFADLCEFADHATRNQGQEEFASEVMKVAARTPHRFVTVVAPQDQPQQQQKMPYQTPPPAQLAQQQQMAPQSVAQPEEHAESPQRAQSRSGRQRTPRSQRRRRSRSPPGATQPAEQAQRTPRQPAPAPAVVTSSQSSQVPSQPGQQPPDLQPQHTLSQQQPQPQPQQQPQQQGRRQPSPARTQRQRRTQSPKAQPRAHQRQRPTAGHGRGSSPERPLSQQQQKEATDMLRRADTVDSAVAAAAVPRSAARGGVRLQGVAGLASAVPLRNGDCRVVVFMVDHEHSHDITITEDEMAQNQLKFLVPPPPVGSTRAKKNQLVFARLIELMGVDKQTHELQFRPRVAARKVQAAQRFLQHRASQASAVSELQRRGIRSKVQSEALQYLKHRVSQARVAEWLHREAFAQTHLLHARTEPAPSNHRERANTDLHLIGKRAMAYNYLTGVAKKQLDVERQLAERQACKALMDFSDVERIVFEVGEALESEQEEQKRHRRSKLRGGASMRASARRHGERAPTEWGASGHAKGSLPALRSSSMSAIDFSADGGAGGASGSGSYDWDRSTVSPPLSPFHKRVPRNIRLELQRMKVRDMLEKHSRTELDEMAEQMRQRPSQSHLSAKTTPLSRSFGGSGSELMNAHGMLGGGGRGGQGSSFSATYHPEAFPETGEREPEDDPELIEEVEDDFRKAVVRALQRQRWYKQQRSISRLVEPVESRGNDLDRMVAEGVRQNFPSGDLIMSEKELYGFKAKQLLQLSPEFQNLRSRTLRRALELEEV